MDNIEIYCAQEQYIEEATQLSVELNLKLTKKIEEINTTYIVYNNDQIGLLNKKISNTIWYLDLNKTAKKLTINNLKKHPLSQAVGLKNKACLVYDLTAGFMKDSVFFAALGHNVVASEINPIIFSIISKANEKLKQETDLNNIKVILQDGEDLLHTNEQPDIIYIDPMFPTSSKSALAKKSMQFLQHITNTQQADYTSLLELAIETAKKKVIVKRPQKGPYLSGIKPSIEISSKQSTRYDVYFK